MRPERQVVFLAGGRATRLRGHGGDIPKALQLVAGVPVIDRLLAAAQDFGLNSWHFALGHQHEQILEHLRGRGVSFTYSLDDLPDGSGTAGALRSAGPQLAENFAIWLADTIPVGGRGGAIAPPAPPRVASMVVSEHVPDVTRNVAVEEGLVVRYDKSGPPGARFVDAGIYSASRVILDHLPAGRADLEELWPRLSGRGLLQAEIMDGTFLDIGTPARLIEAEAAIAIGATDA